IIPTAATVKRDPATAAAAEIGTTIDAESEWEFVKKTLMVTVRKIVEETLGLML
ncbi:hypothetical protein M9458_045195, partial [Cirrhinus mrigala]